MKRSLTALFAPVALLITAHAEAQNLELSLHGGVVVPSSPDQHLADFGAIGGLTTLVRLHERFALGVLIEHTHLRWRAQGAPGFARSGFNFPDDEGSMRVSMLAASGRWYVATIAEFSPYVQLSLGYADYLQLPDHPDCGTGAPVGVQLSGGFAAQVSAWARVGVGVAAHPFDLPSGCNAIAYDGQPPTPPSPGLALSGQLAFTTLWNLGSETASNNAN